LPKIEKKCKK